MTTVYSLKLRWRSALQCTAHTVILPTLKMSCLCFRLAPTVPLNWAPRRAGEEEVKVVRFLIRRSVNGDDGCTTLWTLHSPTEHQETQRSPVALWMEKVAFTSQFHHRCLLSPSLLNSINGTFLNFLSEWRYIFPLNIFNILAYQLSSTLANYHEMGCALGRFHSHLADLSKRTNTVTGTVTINANNLHTYLNRDNPNPKCIFVFGLFSCSFASLSSARSNVFLCT